MPVKKSVVIIGAGITGMSCAHRLGESAVVLEKSERPGGLCKTDFEKGFVFDHVIHLIHWRNENVRAYIEGMLGDNRAYFEREAYTYTHGKFGKYPIQVYVDSFPKDVQLKCFEGLIQAHLEREKKGKQNYKEWLLSKFGQGLCDLFFFPYNEKQWGVPLDQLIPAGNTKFTPKASLNEFVRGTFFHEDVVVGYNPRFFYPLKGGIEVLSQTMASHVKGINCNEDVKLIDLDKKEVLSASGKIWKFDYLVSTMPLPKLIQSIRKVPARVKKSAAQLKYISEYSINIGVKGTPPKGQWTYFPEKKFVFSRISVGSRFSPYMAPDGCYSLWVETFFHPEKMPNIEDLKEKVISQLIEIGYIQKKSDIVVCKTVHMPFAYVIYDLFYEKSMKVIMNFLEKNKIKVAGRFGEWKYTSIEESILDGWRIAKEITEGK